MCPLVTQPCSSARPRIKEYMGVQIELYGQEEEEKRGGRFRGGERGREEETVGMHERGVREGVQLTKIYCTKFPKN